MCGVKLNERKKSEELRTLRIGTSQFDDEKSRFRWFGHVERKDDNDWVKRCITWEVEGIRQRGRLIKIPVLTQVLMLCVSASDKTSSRCIQMTRKTLRLSSRKMHLPGVLLPEYRC